MKKLLFVAIAVFAFGFINALDEETSGFSKDNLYLVHLNHKNILR